MSKQQQEKLQNNHQPNRILVTPNQNNGEPKQNYQNDILEQQDDHCEPFNCKYNCCDENGACPDQQSDCYFYKCENFMCAEGGCCIKGVCRPEKDCKNSKIFRYISIGILVATFLVLQLFKEKIEKFFSEKQWYSCIQNKEQLEQNQNGLCDNIVEKTTQNQIQIENRSSNVLNTHKKNKSTLAAFQYLERNNNLNIFYPQGQRSILQNSNEDNYSNTIFSDNKKDNLVFKNTDVIVDQFAQSPLENRIAQLKENPTSQLSSSFNINKFPMGISELQNQQFKHN
ncbi:transmembrane protein, putative (macronuclear) [Tetrahymena thermophila SB210]|uniref:Transmembrane protein, putative n=1 Tax=Tetrahymena thermophila (strain SB210) TaxID=312017 RepID=Q23A41_TETTS|nr:transmembrane protein, putative [Tetrahymena thermophila SB210]EAR93439.1 transmembrane protein, putative [Tetrahymena thermophila SB210]|eukprot:XP_001013684.1 transmembrane protein, putative [Tetrahymena thermophila SB210]